MDEQKKLTLPAPKREWYRTATGWASRAWTKEARAQYEREAGAWFDGSEDRA